MSQARKHRRHAPPGAVSRLFIVLISAVMTVSPSGASVFAADEPAIDDMGVVDGVVWVDANGDGVRDSDEVGLAGLTMVLTGNTTGSVTTSPSDDDGAFELTGAPPGDYRVEVLIPDGYEVAPMPDAEEDGETVNAFTAIGDTAETSTFEFGPGTQTTLNLGLVPRDDTAVDEVPETTTTTTVPETTTTTAPEATTTTTLETTTEEEDDPPLIAPLSFNPAETYVNNMTFYAYVAADENLDLHFERFGGGGGGTITVEGPGGAGPFACTILATEVTPCDMADLTAPDGGIWSINLQATASNVFFEWGIDVQSGTTTIDGRVWTEFYNMRQGSTFTPADFTFWYQTDLGYLYETTYGGFNGISSAFRADATGIRYNGTCDSAYASVVWNPSQGETPDPDRSPTDPGECGDLFKIFFEQPAGDLPETATRWDGTQDWIIPPVVTPDIVDVTFTPDGTTERSGTIDYQVDNFTGQLVVGVDTDNDGTYDVTIPGSAVDGTGSVQFDGLDGNGDPVSASQDMSVRVSITQAGEIHFMNVEVELRSGGIEVTRLNGPGFPDSTLYWNDTELATDAMCGDPTPVTDGRGGVDSTGGVHEWTSDGCTTISGGWGDARSIDDWAFVPIDESMEIEVPGEVPPNPNAFICDGTAYIVGLNGGANSQRLWRVETGAPPFTFEDVGGPNSGYELNAMGYDPADNLLYALRLRWLGGTSGFTVEGLVSIDATGAVSAPMAVTGLPDGNYFSGDIGPDGDLYVYASGATMYSIDLTTGVATAIPLSQALVIGDFALSPDDGMFYTTGVPGQTGANSVIQIDPSNGDVTIIPITSGSLLGTGAHWFGADGTLFAYGGGDQLYQVDIDAPGGPAVIGANTVPGTARGDGASCADREPAADLSIEKSDDPDPVATGATLTYTLDIFNAGPDSAANVTVSDTLPAEVTFVSATGDGWTCDGTTTPGVVDCTRPLAALGAQPDITIEVTAPAAVPAEPLLNTVTITSETNDPDTSNNEDEEETTLLPPFACPSEGLLFDYANGSGGPTDVNLVDLVSGDVTTPLQVADREINAIGYNLLDDFIYGWDRTELVRIGSDGSAGGLGVPAGIPAGSAFAIGDVDDNGHYWAYVPGTNTWYDVDLATMTATSGTATTAVGSGVDWAYVPGTNKLWRIGRTTTSNSVLVGFDRTTHTWTTPVNLGNLGGATSQNAVGAVYADSDGFLYATYNFTGQIWRIDPSTGTAAFFTDGPISNNNDGARCLQSVPVDFGDADDSFGTTLAADGARHAVPGYDAGTNTAPLMLGSVIDIETDGVPTPGSDGDDAAPDVDDEDAVSGPITFTAGQPTTVPVTVTNDTGGVATLAAWADLNGNGVFDPAELVTVPVTADPGSRSVDVDFDGPFPVCQDVRFRLYPGTVADPSPTGPAAAGEVEDHPVVVEPDCTADDIPLTISGFAQAWTPDSTVQTPTLPASNALNAPDGVGTQLYSAADSDLTLDLSTVVPEGNAVTIHIAQAAAFEGAVEISGSADGTTFSGTITHTPATTQPVYEEFEYVVPAGGARYIRIVPLADASGETAVRVDAVTYSFVTCECEDAVNFVQDGSFESLQECSTQSGDFGDWSVIEANVHIYGVNCVLGWESPDGQNSVDIDGTTTGGIQQLVTGLTPGNSYNLTFYMAFNPAAGADSSSVRVQIADFDETYTSASNATLGGFNLVHVEFTADSPNELLRFESLTGSGDPDLLNGGGTAGFGVVIDNVRITALNCDEIPLVYDFGDADDVYGTTLAAGGPQHAVPGYDPDTDTAPLMLGDSIDIETDGAPTADADGDDIADIDDEDGVADQIVMIIGDDTDVEVVVTNTSGEDATLAGWIDLNDDGVFDAGELQSVVVPSGGTTTETLTFPAVGLPGDGTFARFRLYPGVVDAADLSPTGTAAAGEVEDYPVVGPVVIFLECPNVYALQGTGDYNIYEVDTSNGDMSIVGQIGDGDGTNNGMGISADARYVFSHRDGEVLRYDTQTGVTDTFDGVSGLNSTHGGVDPSSGIYYYGNIGTGAVYAFDGATETNLGQVATLSFDVTPAANNGDWSFDAQGNMYVVGGSTANSGLYVVSGLPTTAQGTPVSVTGEQITTFSTSGAAVNGIAFDATGSLYAASNAVIFEINPSTGDIINTENLDPSGVSVDLASCATPSTIVVQKDIVDRFFETDQFEVTVTGGGIVENNVGVTEGTDTGVQDEPGEFAGTVLGLPGETYDISEAGAAGADLANYVTDWVCVNNSDGGAVVAEGTDVSGSFTMPDSIDGPGAAIECTFTNEPIDLDFGDAPDSYGTTSAANGPQHGLPGLTGTTAPVMLGASVDDETDGQPSAAADGDGADEDGVTFNPALGYTTPVLRTGLDPVSLQPIENTLEVEASEDGFVSVWVDWNQDGDFADAGEQVANAQAVTPGPNDIIFAQGTNPDDISTYVRVRYSTDDTAIATPTGPAPDGEVEDYQVLIERLNQPDACTDSGVEYYAFTFNDPADETILNGAPGSTSRYSNVAVVDGVAVDMFVEVVAGQMQPNAAPLNGFRLGDTITGDIDDAQWQINGDATVRYTFYEAGTTDPVPVNAVFTVSDMDFVPPNQIEIATFSASDLADYAVTQGSAVTIVETGGNVEFHGGGGQWSGDPESRFQFVLEGISSFETQWEGAAIGNGSGFAYDGDGDRSIQPPACEDWGDAPDSYGTTAAANGPNHTIDQGMFLGSLIDFDTDGQPSVAADGDDTNNLADEDGVTFNSALGYLTPVLRTGLDPVSLQPVENTLEVEASEDGFVSVWVDWNQDGDFADAGEQVANAQAVTPGPNDIIFAQGTNPDDISAYVRVRYSTDEGSIATPTGPAPDGEVEDYQVLIERLNQPDACVDSGEEYYAFTFSSPVTTGEDPGSSTLGNTALYSNVSVVNGVPVDVFVEIIDGDLRETTLPPHGIGVGTGTTIGTDDAQWNVQEDATLRYTFYEAGTTNPVAINGVFTINDMDQGVGFRESGSFDPADLAAYAVTQGSAVTIGVGPNNISFLANGDWDGDPQSRFQIVLEGISTFDARWRGAAGSGFGFDGDGDLSIDPPACEDWGDAPDSYGTTAATNGPNHTIDQGMFLGSLIDFDTDGQPSAAADGDDTNNLADEDGVTFNPALGYPTPVLRTGLDPVSLQPVENTLEVEASEDGFVSVWVDWNQDGDFADAGEQVANAQAVTPGPNDVIFAQGTNPDDISAYVRVRYSTDEGSIATPTGPAPDGEVEDYQVLIERLNQPDACVDSGEEYYSFTFGTPTDTSGSGGVGSAARYENVAVIEGVQVDMLAEVVGGSLSATGFFFAGGDDAAWNIDMDATITYTFYEAGTNNAVPINGVFTVNDMDDFASGRETATFDAADLASYAVTQGSAVDIQESAGEVTFLANGIWSGDPESRFQFVLEGIETFEVHWTGGGNSGFTFDGDGDLSIDPPACEDLGDAPASYDTLLTDNGPSHTIVPGLFLGSEIDFDPDGQPSPDADGDDTNRLDDEDGVSINPSIPGNVMITQAGGLNTAEVTVTGDGFLSAWIDLDQNGVFDPGETIFDDEPVTDGVNNLSFAVPNTVSHGETYARFRLASEEDVANTPTGPAPDGEVEDYLVHVAAPVSMACDAGLVNSGFEEPVVTGPTPFLADFGGTIKIYHESVVPGWSFTSSDPTAGTDDERNAIEIWGTPSPAAFEGGQFAEINAYLFGFLYQDMVTTPGTTLTWQFAHRGRAGEDTIALNIGAPGATVQQTVETTDNTAWQVYTGQYVVPAGQFITRFEFVAVDTAGGNTAVGNFLDAIQFGILCPTDYGDAPDSYGTSLANNGASHEISAYDDTDDTAELMLGPSIDSELDGLPSVGADGDDSDVADDEDGVAAPINMAAGAPTTVTVAVTNNTAEPATLAGWIDLDANGTFDPSELATVAVPANTVGDFDLVFPAGTATTNSYARFRLFPGDATDPLPTGSATAGEIEDYPVSAALVHYEKTVTPDDVAVLQPGDTFTYTVTVSNLGAIPLTNPSFTDDLSGVVGDGDAIYNNDATVVSGPGAVSFTPDVISWDLDGDTLDPGEQSVVEYSVTIADPPAGDAILANGVLGTGPGSNCVDDPATDPDCYVEIPQPDIEGVKTSDAVGNVEPGQIITYQFTINNVGPGNALNAVVWDDLSGVLDDAVYNNDAQILAGGPGNVSFDVANQRIVWNGPLDVAGDPVDSVTIEYTVTVNDAESLGDASVRNALLMTGCPFPAIYDPADPEYDPDCVVVDEVEAWTVAKTSDAQGQVVAGDTVTYTVTLENTGNVDLTSADVVVNDDLTDVLDDAVYNNDATDGGHLGGFTFIDPDLTWSGDLDVDEVVTLTYSVTVNEPDALGNGQIVNAVTGGECLDPVITDPTDPDFDPDCVVIDDIVAYTVDKSSDAANPVMPGDVVTYTLTVENTGSIDLTAADVLVSDDLTDTLDDAAYNNDATQGAILSDPFITWFGDLDVDEVVTITYSVTVNDADELGDGQLLNAVTGGDCPVPAVTDPQAPDFDPDCVTIDDIEAWTAVKSSNASDPVLPGDEIEYTIEIENTGNVALTAAQVVNVDDLTEVLDDASYDGNADDGAHAGTFDFTAPTLTWTGDLAVDEQVTLTYSVTVNDADDLGDGQLVNAITGSTNCPDPAITDPQDPNFDPDCVNVEDVEAWTAIKTSDAAGNLEPGDTVAYTIEIENTGNVALTAAQVVNVDDLSEVLDDASYDGNADDGAHAGTFDFTSPELTWTGDLAVDEQVTLTYSVTVNDADDLGDGQLVNAITGSTNCPDPAVTDPQDPNFDPDCVNVEDVEAWTAIKTSDAAGNLEPGDTVAYTIEIENTGNVPLTAADVVNVDDLSEVLDDASYDGNADDAGHSGTFDFTSPELTWTGDLAVDEQVTLTYSVTVNDADDLGDGQLVNAITGSPNCPDPAITDPQAAGFDSDCVPTIDTEAWTAVKTSDAAGAVEPGDTVNYTITLENTGNVPLTAINVDDLTEVLDDASYDGNADDAGHSGTFDFTAPTLTWSGDLAVDDLVLITYSVTINDATELGDGQLVNAITGPPNCPDPAITDPQAAGFDPDCVPVIDIEAWTAIKTSDAVGNVEPGDTVTYTIAVENTGNVDLLAADVVVEDDLTEVLDDASYDGNVGQGATYAAPVIAWSADLDVDEVVVITYSVTVNDATDLGDGELVNAITGPPNCPDPAITDPQDPGFDPDCVNIEDVEAWTVAKTSDAAGNVEPGDTVVYTIEIENTGNLAVTAINTDDLTDVLDDASFDGNADDGGQPGTFDFTAPTLTWTGDLAVDETVTLTYSVTVNEATDLGDGQLLNAITGSTNCPDPAITDPQDPGFDPDCVNVEDVEAWTAIKTSDAAGTVEPGDTVTYTIEVENTGNVALAAADVVNVDDLTEVLDDASYDGNADDGGHPGAFAFTAPTLTWSGDLAVDEVVTLTYSVTINDADDLGDGQLLNAITGSKNCPDPAITDPQDPNFDPDCVNIEEVAAYTVVKTSDAVDPVLPGDEVEYTVVVTNTGNVDLIGPDAATFDDDLSGVLDDATFNDDEAADIGTATFGDPVLAWSGDLLVDEVATITYSVTVDQPIGGDHQLVNAVVGGDCPDPTITDPEDPAFDETCVVVDPLPGVDIDKVIVGDPVTELQPGDTFEYVVTVENIGQVDLVGETFSDDLSEVLDDAALDAGSLTADIGLVSYANPEVTWIGDLDIGETATIRYSITIDDPITGNAELLNAVVGSIYSNCVPPDPADPDCWEETPLPNVIVEKTMVSPVQPQPGDVVTYQITAENQGGATALDEPITDDLSGVLDDAVYNDDATASQAGGLSYSEPVISWTGDIAAGETLVITYSVTVNDYVELGDASLDNAVTGGENCPDDVDMCTTRTPLPTFEAVKTTVSPSEFGAGEVVTYQVSITNTSDVIADTAEVTDDLSGVLDDATYNGDASAASGEVGYSEPILTWNGALTAGQVVTLTYSVTVNEADQLGDGELENVITAPNCGEHSDLTTLSHENCFTLNQVEAVRYNKTIISPEGSIRPGDTVTYQVTVSNVGAADLTGLEFTDDLSNVLEHATFRHDQAASTGTVTYQSERLAWTGDLAAGQTAAVTYSVRLDGDAPAGAALDNVVVGNGPGSNCPPGSNNGDCIATMVLSESSLPFTGADLIALVIAALAMLAIGVLTVMTTRRRES